MAKKDPTDTGPQPSRNWKKKGNGKVACNEDPVQKCSVVPLREARRSAFHDAELQDATQEINKILDRVVRGNDDPSRHACLINVQGQPLLVWTEHEDAVTDDDDPAKVAEALKLTNFDRR